MKNRVSAILLLSAGIRGVKNSIEVLLFGEHFTTIRLKTRRNLSVSMNLKTFDTTLTQSLKSDGPQGVKFSFAKTDLFQNSC